MLFLYSLFFAVLGYLIGIHCSLLTQVVVYIGWGYFVFTSDKFMRAELLQLVYVANAAMVLLGTAIGNFCYAFAHWSDTSVSGVLAIILNFFRP